MIYLLASILLSSALGELTRIDLGHGIAFTLLDIVICFYIFIGVIKLYIKRPSLPLPTKPLVIFWGICLISLLVNIPLLHINEVEISFLYLLRFVLYSSTYIITSVFIDKKNKIFPLFFFTGSIAVIGGLLQYFYYPSLRNLYYLGWDEHLYRLFSTFLDPNFAGTFLVLLFFIGLHFLFSFWQKNTRILAVLFSILNTTILLTIFLTYSRSAYLSLFAGLIGLVVIYKKTKFLIAGIIMLIIAVSIFTITYGKKTEGTDLLRINSSFARVESYQKAFIVWSKEPLLGSGFNAYRYAQHRDNLLIGKNWETSHSGAGVENSFLFILATTGIVGLLTYLWLWKSILITTYQVIKTNKLSQIVFVCLISLLVSSMFINSLFYPSIMVVMWVFLGAITD